MSSSVWIRAKRVGIGIASVVLAAATVLVPAGAAHAATVQYIPVIPTKAYVGDTVQFSVTCPYEVGATCPTGGTGSVSIDGTKIGNLGPALPYRVNWTAALGSHTVTMAFTDVTTAQLNVPPVTINVLPRQPAAPTGVIVTPDANNHYTASWSAPSESGASTLTGYQVSIDGGAPQSTTQTSFDVTYVTPGSHTVYVAATNSDGTGPNGSGNFYRAPTTTASAPILGTPVFGPNASLSWSAPAQDGGSQITGYSIQVDSTNIYAQDASSTTFSVANVPGIAYGTHTIAVSAVNANGQGAAASAQVLYANTPASMSGLVTVNSYGSKPLATWTAPDSRGADISGYLIYIDNHRNPDQVAGNVLSYSIANQTVGSHTFHIAAVNAYSTANNPVYTSVTFTVAAPTVPLAPQNIVFTDTDHHPVASWSAPSNDGGSLVTGYSVSIDGGPAVTVSGTSYDLTSVAPSVTAGDHTFAVSAKNAIGTGTAASAPFTRDPVSVPAVVSVTGATSGPAPSLNWAAPTDDGGEYITGYAISIDGGAPVVASGKDTVSYIVQTAGLAYGQHTATVAAINSVGTGPESATFNFTFESVPTAPTNVQLTTGVAQPIVSWTGSTVQGGSIQKYNIYVDGVVVGSTTDGSSSNFTLPVQVPGVHSLAVTAVSLFSESTQSVAVSFTAPSAPDTPTGVSATADLGQVISVSWTQPSNDGGAPVTGYTITVDPGVGQVVFKKSGSASGTNVPVTGTFAQGHHTVIVTADNGVGSSIASASVGVDVFAPIRLTITKTATPAIGHNVTISGVAYVGTTTTPAAAETVNLVKIVGGSPVQLGTASTGPDGSYSFTVPVPTGTVFQVLAPGDVPKFLASGSSVTAVVSPIVAATLQVTAKGPGGRTARVSLTKLGTRLSLTVTVNTVATGTRVNLQVRLGSGAWKTVAGASFSGKSAKASWTPTKVGKYSVRAVVANKTGVFTGTTTSRISVTITK